MKESEQAVRKLERAGRTSNAVKEAQRLLRKIPVKGEKKVWLMGRVLEVIGEADGELDRLVKELKEDVREKELEEQEGNDEREWEVV